MSTEEWLARSTIDEATKDRLRARLRRNRSTLTYQQTLMVRPPTQHCAGLARCGVDSMPLGDMYLKDGRYYCEECYDRESS